MKKIANDFFEVEEDEDGVFLTITKMSGNLKIEKHTFFLLEEEAILLREALVTILKGK